MKKLIIGIMMIACAIVANAATVNWSVTTTSAEVGQKVFLFTSPVEATYDTYAELIAGAIADAEIIEYGGRNKKYGTGSEDLMVSVGDAKQIYGVLVSGPEAKAYSYATFDVTDYTYDPGKQETAPGTLALTQSSFTSSGTIGGGPTPPGPDPIPEPTSGLLLLLGVAGLALRRRRA